MPEVVEETHTAQVATQEIRDSLPQEAADNPGYRSIFRCRLPVFEGPLDLLLHLIRENKIDIYDIPIVEITRQYLLYIELMKELNLDIAGDFLVMAATLIHIKSRMLLPADEEAPEESAEDPRDELVKRLLEYQAFKESSVQLRQREELWKNVFRRPLPDMNDCLFEEEPALIEANVFDLITAFQKLLDQAPQLAVEISRETLTVADKINYIIERIGKEEAIQFEALFGTDYTRMNLIVTFLALLEIVRLGLARIFQESAFVKIWILNPGSERPSNESSPEQHPQESIVTRDNEVLI